MSRGHRWWSHLEEEPIKLWQIVAHRKVMQYGFNILRQNGSNFADDVIKCIFSNEHCCILIKVSLIFCFPWSHLQHASIGSDNGLAPNRRQVIGTNYSLVCWRIYASLGTNMLKLKQICPSIDLTMNTLHIHICIVIYVWFYGNNPLPKAMLILT